jgi:hypothetical protein
LAGLPFCHKLIRYPVVSDPAVSCRKPVMSRSGGTPKRRLYSRLNWDELS